MIKHHTTLLLFLLLASCKTAEEIRREQLVDTMSVQVGHLQKQSSHNTFQIQEHEDRLNQIYGQLEETQHEGKQKILEKEKERIKSLEELTTRLTAIEKKLMSLEAQNTKQSSFIKEATKQLQLRLKKSSRKKKNREKTKLNQAMKMFKQKKDKKAQGLLLQLLGRKKLKPARWVKSHHTLGLIHYRRKRYEQAMVHMSKVYTRYPKSSKAPGSLLIISKSFLKTGQKLEAKGSVEQLIKQYPKSKEAKEGQKLLKKL